MEALSNPSCFHSSPSPSSWMLNLQPRIVLQQHTSNSTFRRRRGPPPPHNGVSTLPSEKVHLISFPPCSSSGRRRRRRRSSSSSSSSSSRARAQPTVAAMSHKASAGYASALAETARSRDVLDAVMSDVQTLGRLLSDPNLHTFLVNPTALDQHKKAVLETLARNAAFSPYTLNLLSLVVDRKRTGILKDIVAEFEELYNEMTGTEVAVVISAVKIDTPRLARIATKVQRLTGAKNVRMKNVVDASLVAGFVVRYGKNGSRLVDMSVKSELAHIAQEITSLQTSVSRRECSVFSSQGKP